MRRALILPTMAACLALAATSSAQDSQAALHQKVAALKQSMAQNQQRIRHYVWTENTQLSLKGEVKSTKIESCQYGPDGKVQKVLLSAPPDKKEARGLKKKIIENKTDDMKEYMERATALIQQYVPPPSDLVQDNLASGDTSLTPLGGDAMQIQFKNFLKGGDAVTFVVDKAAKSLRQLKVNTYLDQDKDTVDLTVDFRTLPDGTSYAAAKNLSVAAKQIVVQITTSNYQKLP